MIYDEVINEYGFDPQAPGPRVEPFQPWSMRGAMEILTGRTDVTEWTRSDGQALQRMLMVGDEPVEIPGETLTIHAPDMSWSVVFDADGEMGREDR